MLLTIDTNACAELGLNIVDYAIFDYMRQTAEAGMCECLQLNGEDYFKFSYEQIAKDLPSLGIKTAKGIAWHIRKIEAVGLLTRYNPTNNAPYFKFTQGVEKNFQGVEKNVRPTGKNVSHLAPNFPPHTPPIIIQDNNINNNISLVNNQQQQQQEKEKEKENFAVAVDVVAEVEDLGEKKNEAPLQEVLNPNKRERENKQRERETAEAIGRLRTDLFSSPLKCESAMRTAGILDEAELRTMAEDVFTEWKLVGTPPEDVNLRHLLNQLRIKVRAARKAARQPKTRQERIAESLRQIYAPADYAALSEHYRQEQKNGNETKELPF